MRKLLTLAFVFAAFISAASHLAYQTGTLVNVSDDEKFTEGTSLRTAIFTVQIGDLVYTARGGRIRRHSCDVAKGLIVGDPLRVAIKDESLIMLKPDGKELKPKIIKRERVR